jgi:hypothetical protein
MPTEEQTLLIKTEEIEISWSKISENLCKHGIILSPYNPGGMKRVPGLLQNYNCG